MDCNSAKNRGKNGFRHGDSREGSREGHGGVHTSGGKTERNDNNKGGKIGSKNDESRRVRIAERLQNEEALLHLPLTVDCLSPRTCVQLAMLLCCDTYVLTVMYLIKILGCKLPLVRGPQIDSNDNNDDDNFHFHL